MRTSDLPAPSSVVNRLSGQLRNSRFAVVIAMAMLPVALVTGRHLGSDANFDLLSYHAYIGEAALARRWSSDIAPAGLGSFHNPLFDLPGALALRHSVQFFTAWLSVEQWLCWLSLWWFVRVVLRERDRSTQLLALIFALTGSAAMSLSITSFVDWPVAALLLASLTAALSFREHHLIGSPQTSRLLVVSGLFGAGAVAAKLTATSYLIGLFAVVLVVARRLAWKWLAGFAACTAALCLPWWIYLQRRFSNPLFPYYNQVFKSPDGPVGSFDDTRFGAGSLQDFVRFPIDFARGTSRYSELPYRDLRWILVIVTIAAWSTLQRGTLTELRTWRMIGVFAGIGYLQWLVSFGIYRYALILELIASVFLIAAAIALVPKIQPVALAVVLSLTLAFQISPNWGRSTPLRVKLPVTPGQRVLFADMGPSAYLVNSLTPDTKLASIQGFAYGLFSLEGSLGRDLDRFVKDGLSDGSLRIVINPAADLQPIVKQLGIAPDLPNCAGFAGPFGSLAVCPAIAAGS